MPALINLRGYPALILMYVAALGAAFRRNFTPLVGFAVEPAVRDTYQPRDRIPVVALLNARSIVSSAEQIAAALAHVGRGP